MPGRPSDIEEHGLVVALQPDVEAELARAGRRGSATASAEVNGAVLCENFENRRGRACIHAGLTMVLGL